MFVMMYYAYKTVLGIIYISSCDEKIVGCSFDKPDGMLKETKVIREASIQLYEYLDGKRKSFDIPLSFNGTDFQNEVYKALLSIPYGDVVSYKDIAIKINHPYSFRAIGQANHSNPIMIFVPCHRVINSNGKIGGYNGGVKVKKYLLALEGVEL